MGKTTASNQKTFKGKTGTEYILQKVSPSAWLDAMDEADEGNGKRSRKKLYAYVLENIVVQPRVTLDDFSDYSEVEELVAEAIRFQQGK